MAHYLEFKKLWKSGFHGVTKQGLPVWIDVLGSSEPEKISSVYNYNQVQEY